MVFVLFFPHFLLFCLFCWQANVRAKDGAEHIANTTTTTRAMAVEAGFLLPHSNVSDAFDVENTMSARACVYVCVCLSVCLC